MNDLCKRMNTTAQFEIKLCDRSSVTTATDRTGAQSKFSVKNLHYKGASKGSRGAVGRE